jgi:Domain of unknown function (DUF222)
MSSWESPESPQAGDGLSCSGAVDQAVALLSEGINGLDARDLAARLGDVERSIRKLEAVAVSIVASADRRELFREDGHASVRGWVKASVRVSDRTVTQRVRTAKLCTALPQCHAALAGGALGLDQVRELARVHANPRCGAQIGSVIDPFIDLAAASTFEVFAERVREWVALADADGAHRAHEAAHAGRTARIALVGEEGFLDARMGSVQFASMKKVLDQFTQAEFDAEWDDLRARHGDDACPALLERTDGQRRADALAAIFQRAATADCAAADPEPVVDVVVDQAVYEAQLEAMVRGEPARFPTDGIDGHRCRTTDGVPVDPADAVVASLIGHVRRVVLDGSGRIIDLGHRSRIFTGGARQAALLQAAVDSDGRCLWPGCGLHRCQIDHSVGWSEGGSTTPANAGPLCPRHNRWKTRGYRCWRDPNGVWHTSRPDGTEICAA